METKKKVSVLEVPGRMKESERKEETTTENNVGMEMKILLRIKPYTNNESPRHMFGNYSNVESQEKKMKEIIKTL